MERIDVAHVRYRLTNGNEDNTEHCYSERGVNILNRGDLARPLWLLPPGRLHPLWWVPVGVGLIWLDYVDGANAQYPVVYVIPVALAAWYSGRWPALALAAAVPFMHGVFLTTLWNPQGDVFAGVGPTILRATVIIVLALWFARLSEHERELHRYMERLEGLLPICAFCKSIRNKDGDWEPLETYISERSEAEFTHGFCPTCGKTHYPEIEHDVPTTANRVN